MLLTPGSPAHPQVRSTFQRSLNFPTPVLLLAQLAGPAWPFHQAQGECPLIAVGMLRLLERKNEKLAAAGYLISELGHGESRHHL